MEELSHLLALPGALGTGIIIRSDAPINPHIRAFASEYEQVLSRFRNDSLVTAMANSPYGGSFDFPDWTEGLFELYDRLVDATDGAIDPCVGEDLIRLGYNANLIFGDAYSTQVADGNASEFSHSAAHNEATPQHTTQHDALQRSAARHSIVHHNATSQNAAQHNAPSQQIPKAPAHYTTPNQTAPQHATQDFATPQHPTVSDDPWQQHPTWRNDVERHGTTLITKRAIHLDFGACGKGYLVDLLSRMITNAKTDVAKVDTAISGTTPHGTPSPKTTAPSDTHSFNAHSSDAHSSNMNLTAVQSPSQHISTPAFVIDAGGDLLVHTHTPFTIALEDPHDTSRAVGTARITNGAFCASAPSRRRWRATDGTEVHHLLNAVDGLPVDDVAATWVAVNEAEKHNRAVNNTKGNVNTGSRNTGSRNTGNSNTVNGKTVNSSAAVSTSTGKSTTNFSTRNPLAYTGTTDHLTNYPTALADGLATALFVADPNLLAKFFRFECIVLNTDRTAVKSRHFPGTLFTRGNHPSK